MQNNHPEQNIIPEKKLLRSSTHSMINAALYTASAVTFIGTDARLPLSPRFLGDLLWLKSSSFNMWLAKSHERMQENYPDKEIRPCGVHPSFYNLMGEIEYFMSGLLYLYANCSAEKILPLKIAGNICWLLASFHEVKRTYGEYKDRNLNLTHFKPQPSHHANVNNLENTEQTLRLTV